MVFMEASVDSAPTGFVEMRTWLEEMYGVYNSRKWVHPDPLEFLYRYSDLRDREVVGLVASLLAYGRVTQILRSVTRILQKMGRSPYEFLKSARPGKMEREFEGFRHRFTSGEEIAWLLVGMRRLIERYGSLYGSFTSGLKRSHDDVLPALSDFVHELNEATEYRSRSLVSVPDKGSACKRWHLFLRWMVRKDKVDPGGWEGIGAQRLIIPLDVHMHKMCLHLNLTKRKNACLGAAKDATRGFRKINPGDPVRYDFALTRLGIRKDNHPSASWLQRD